jgi:hypothetical protein
MKTPVRHFINRFGLTFLVLLAALFWAAGCATRTPDPLAGWRFSSLNNLHSNKAITDDYQDYIQKLPSKKRQFVGAVDFFEDGMGQHAVDIKMGVDGTWWEHVLIYDKENKRIKVVRYADGKYSQW